MGQVNMENPPPKLLDQVSNAIRTKHYSLRTEKTYKDWIRRYILFHHKRHPKEMGVPEVQAFITYLVTQNNIAASTQNQALSAITFLYRHVLHIELEFPADTIRPEKSRHIPVVLTKPEVLTVISTMNGITKLMTKILYGSGLPRSPLRKSTSRRLTWKNHHDLHACITTRRTRRQIPP